ncbi:MAG: M28 family peptidase [Planctomycetota bacterium]
MSFGNTLLNSIKKIKIFPSTKKEWMRAILLWSSLLFLILATGCYMVLMPGSSYQGSLPPLDSLTLELKANIETHIRMLAETIGERELHSHYKQLQQAADYVEKSFQSSGYTVNRQEFKVLGKSTYNLEVEILGQTYPKEIVVIGAHYDSCEGTLGANDNGSGVASILELARLFAKKPLSRTLRFVAFTNEEPPYFQTENMGSLVYARRCRERQENITAMFSLETMGFYSEKEGSQFYPFPFNLYYPTKGNFIGFVGNLSSRSLVRKTVGSFRTLAKFPSEGVAAPNAISGIGWSDQWSFWQVGYSALMVTDTAPFRYPHYHTHEDTWEKVNYEATARVLAGLYLVFKEFVGESV